MGLGFIFSLCGCILFAVNAFILEVISTSHNLAIAMIFAPMMIHMVGHNLLIPMTLSYALKDYAKVTGTARIYIWCNILRSYRCCNLFGF
ncbi:hypothetical protein RPATATE_0633 [Rickettsia parkeri str. Tate's Hell]|uniref:Uncharacterized protein n=1 Tax=Rickettsia parkeri str. Tate's Hell TaxID=1359189 RepID=A0ABR5DQP6_RICPA|nr:bicyclomycin resistance protein [Rickettsia parkeri str. Portsmouth]KJV93886.1 hypothetical protein RPAGB_0649 [Rickettsia parkeri str. Grand Bay]KJV96016.1 hypothetical protein RPAAT24_0289 [Rickettsia parkeri str. AT\